MNAKLTTSPISLDMNIHKIRVAIIFIERLDTSTHPIQVIDFVAHIYPK